MIRSSQLRPANSSGYTMTDIPFIRNFKPGYVVEWPDQDLTKEQVHQINDEYVLLFKDDPWYKIIDKTHLRLEIIDENYRIVQIKEKFGELTYYFKTDTDKFWEMQAVVNDAAHIARAQTYSKAYPK